MKTTTKEPSTIQMIKSAIADARTLFKLEVALAKDEVRSDLSAAKVSVITFGVAASAAVIGISLVLVGVSLAIAPTFWSPLSAGAGLLALGAGAAFWAYKTLPKKPMHRTRERLELDVKTLKERTV